MCVIAVKPKGVNMPDRKTIEKMWIDNPDGAGFMWADGKCVHIRKGFMDLESFISELVNLGSKHNLIDLPIVMHFRIGTAGGNIPENTHPFPVTDSIQMLQRTESKAAVGVAHNGIIYIKRRQENISDTMEYIASQMALMYKHDHEFYRKKELLDMIYNATTSKWAIMNEKGDIVTIGNFTNIDGVMYSNTYFNWRTPYGRCAQVDHFGYDSVDHRFFDLYYEDIEQVELMMLPYDAFIYNTDGSVFTEVADTAFMIDQWGVVYVMDLESDIAIPIEDDVHVYAKDMSTIQFQKDRAHLTPTDFGRSVSLYEIVADDDFDFDFVDDKEEGEDNSNG